MCLHQGTRQRVLECRKRLRRSRVMQKGTGIAAAVDTCETRGAWPQRTLGGASLKASTDAPPADEARTGSETARAPMAEVDHFRSLRAR